MNKSFFNQSLMLIALQTNIFQERECMFIKKKKAGRLECLAFYTFNV